MTDSTLYKKINYISNKINEIHLSQSQIFISNDIEIGKLNVCYTNPYNSKINFIDELNDYVGNIIFSNTSNKICEINKLPLGLMNFTYKENNDKHKEYTSTGDINIHFKKLTSARSFFDTGGYGMSGFSKFAGILQASQVYNDENGFVRNKITEIYADNNVFSKFLEMALQRHNQNLYLESYSDNENIEFKSYKPVLNKNITSVMKECDNNFVIMGVDLFTLIKIGKRNKKIIYDYKINNLINSLKYLMDNKNDFKTTSNKKIDLVIILNYSSFSEYSNIFNDVLTLLQIKITGLGGEFLSKELFKLNILNNTINTL